MAPTLRSQALFDLSEDVAVVTGAGRGIGEGIAITLADAGAAVVCAARRVDEIERVAAGIRDRGGRAIAVATDVTDNAAVSALAQAAVSEFGHLDIWINNAGGSPVQEPLMTLDEAEWDATLRLNLTAVWMCTRVAAAHMRDGGRVVNISSLAATTTMPGSGHYAAAKAGVNSLTRTFAKELGPKVRVNCIMPGAVPTEIMMTALKLADADLPALEKRLRLPMRRLGTPDDLGQAVLYFVSPASEWVTGQILSIDGGMTS
jgi:3-oxoacyl-[acyl-carrier protein] reductase